MSSLFVLVSSKCSFAMWYFGCLIPELEGTETIALSFSLF